MNGKLVMVAVSLALLLLACGPKEPMAPEQPLVQPPIPEARAPVVVQEQVDKPPQPLPAATETDETIADIEISTAEVDDLEMDFDTSDLDQLDADLAELETLDLG